MAKISKYKKKNGQVAWMYKGHIATDPRTGEKINTTRRGFSSKQEAQKIMTSTDIKYYTVLKRKHLI